MDQAILEGIGKDYIVFDLFLFDLHPKGLPKCEEGPQREPQLTTKDHGSR